MESKDLRIGNYIYDDVDGLHQITSIDDLELGLVGDAIEYKYAKPIPLTKEWLARFGFKKNLYIDGYIGCDSLHTSFVLSEPNKFKEYYTFNFGVGDLTNIKELIYVHELQNLYFALTGEELELKHEYKP